MNEKRDANSAHLYRLNPDLSLTSMLDDMMISNGLGFSPDGRTMYHSDTPPQTVRAYDFDGDRGTLSNSRVFAHFDGDGERPDGAAVDSEGCYWSAFYRGGKLVRLSPSGQAPGRISGARAVSDHVRLWWRGPAHALCDERASVA